MGANIYDWDVVAANNATADADLTWAEGQAPSTVNNSARVMMQRGKQLLIDLGGSLSAGGTANALTLTAQSPFTALADGRLITFRATASNTTAATINVNAIGTKPIVLMTATGEAALAGGEILDTGIYQMIYSTELAAGAGAWLLINPSVNGSYLPLTGGTLVSTNAGAAAGPTLNLFRDSATPAASDVLGYMSFTGRDSATNVQLYSEIYSFLTDPTTTTEDAELRFTTTVAGSTTQRLALNSVGARVDGSITSAVGGGVNAIFATPSAGIISLRPNGEASTTGQFFISSTGDAQSTGDIISGGTSGFSTTVGVYARASAGTMFFRPNGISSSLNQGTYDSSGNFTAAGNVTAFSDKRLKKNIRALKGSGKIIDQIVPVSFKRKADGRAGVGFIAQDFIDVLPEVIVKHDDGMLSLAYGNLTALLWNEVKDLRKRLAAIEAAK